MTHKIISVVILLTTAAAATADRSIDDAPLPACWSELMLLSLDLKSSINSDEWDARKVAEGKAQLREVIEAKDFDCPDYAELYSVPASRKLKHSLIGIAVLADSPQVITNHRELVHDGIRNGEDLEDFGLFAHLAAAFESHNSLVALADIGVDVTRNDHWGRTPIHAARTRTMDGIRNVALLARAGVDLDAKVPEGLTALLMSYLRQEFDLSVCLRLLGATEPSHADYMYWAKMKKDNVFFAEDKFAINDEMLSHSVTQIEQFCGE